MNTKNILTLQNPGIVPPRREIGNICCLTYIFNGISFWLSYRFIDMLRKYYRNEVPVKNEFARAKMFK